MRQSKQVSVQGREVWGGGLETDLHVVEDEEQRLYGESLEELE